MIFGNLFKSKPKPQQGTLDSNKMSQILDTKVPDSTLNYCVKLWQEQPFTFKITKTRNTCLGNYRYFKGHHTITVNHDLNKYSFLITYIHEIAHQRVTISSLNKRKKPLPHGNEWKQAFIDLFEPVLSQSVFPNDLYIALKHYMKNPKASSTSDHKLLHELRKFDISPQENISILADLEIQSLFEFKGNIYKKIENRRTRVLVEEIKTKKRYTIPKIAEINNI